MKSDDIIHGDRRAERRYDFQMELRFGYQRAGRKVWSTGRTIDLSRTSILFEADRAIPDGTEVELQIEWPFLLHGVSSLVLKASGVVLRTDERGTVLQMTTHEFRTAGARGEVVAGNIALIA